MSRKNKTQAQEPAPPAEMQPLLDTRIDAMSKLPVFMNEVNDLFMETFSAEIFDGIDEGGVELVGDIAVALSQPEMIAFILQNPGAPSEALWRRMVAEGMVIGAPDDYLTFPIGLRFMVGGLQRLAMAAAVRVRQLQVKQARLAAESAFPLRPPIKVTETIYERDDAGGLYEEGFTGLSQPVTPSGYRKGYADAASEGSAHIPLAEATAEGAVPAATPGEYRKGYIEPAPSAEARDGTQGG